VTTITPRTLACPLCATSFDGWSVLPSRDRGPLTSDLRRIPEGEDPLPKMLNACPGCGLCGDVSRFEEHAPKPDQKVPAANTGAYFSQDAFDDARDPLLADRPPEVDSTLVEQLATLGDRIGATDPAIRWENAAQVERWLNHGPLKEGDAMLRAAWMHEDAGREEDGRRCRRRALACYRQGITEKRWFGRREDLVIVGYLCGELHRRLGDRDVAIQWFEQAIAWSSGLQKLQELVELAERQMLHPTDLV
jgi:uncharacterized protein (DUF2225 family)